MYRISVLLPSAYPDKLERFITNLREISFDFASLEIIVVLDGDSPTIKEENFTYVYVPKMSPNYRSKLFEVAYRHSTAPWIFLGNDDIEIRTKSWDSILDFSNPWKLYHFFDNQYNERFGCHPLTSRQVWEVADKHGLVFPPFQNMGCDTTLWDIMPKECRAYRQDIKLVHQRFIDADKQREIDDDYRIYHTMNPIRMKCRDEILELSKIQMDPIKIMLAIPTGEVARRADFYDHLNMMHKPAGTILSSAHGQSPAKNRNIMIEQAIESNCSHVMFVDDDAICPPDTIARLLAHDKDIVSGLYLMRNFPHCPIIFEKVDKLGRYDWMHLKDDPKTLKKIVGCGLGCCLIKTSVFKNMEKPWIRLGELEPDHWSDDLGFFKRVREELPEVEMYCDMSVMVGHTVYMTLYPYWDGEKWHSQYDSAGMSRINVPQLDLKDVLALNARN